MEIVILICLLIVIVLLVQDRIALCRGIRSQGAPEKVNSQLPDIMGEPKVACGQTVPISATNDTMEVKEPEAVNFDIEIDANEVDIQIPQEELDDVFGTGPNLDEEEEEWRRQDFSGGDIGFATGVTFEELSTVGMLLHQDVLESSQQRTAVGIVRKIQGTELFYLLEQSMEGASRRMAELLDKSLSTMTDSGSSTMRNKDFDDFDIGEFV